MEVSRLFERTYNETRPIIVHEGGTSSGKTYAILQALLVWAVSNRNETHTVVGQDIPNLKKGSYRDIQNIIETWPEIASHLVEHNKTDRTFRFASGSVIEFVSYDDAQDAKNGKRHRLFCNELNGIDYAVWAELQQRTTIVSIADFNPTAEFWAHERLRPRPDVAWISSNFKHNPFIAASIKSTILGYEPTPENVERGTADEWRWKVYGLGQLGRLVGAIFENWRDHQRWPEAYQWRVFGLDFGFTNDPTALVEICVAGGELHLRELIYDRGLTNHDISARLRSLGLSRTDEIVCDSAEPKSIEELSRLGWNVHAAVKGTDSIMHGIDLLKRYRLNVCGESANLGAELKTYRWKVDRNGNTLNEPVDTNNHAIDAIRYAVTYKLKPRHVALKGGALV